MKTAKTLKQKSTISRANASITLNHINKILSRELTGRQPATKNLTTKHFEILRQYWNEKGLNDESQKTYFSTIRSRIAELGGTKPIPTNKELGFKRKVKVIKDRSQTLEFALSKIKIERYQDMLKLASLGLRRSEVLQIKPNTAIRRNDYNSIHISTKVGKGQRARVIHLTTAKERKTWMEFCKKYPFGFERKGISLENARNNWKSYAEKRGVRIHGLRHKWAQDKFFEMTGYKAPVLTGAKFMKEERNKIEEVRKFIKKAMGHGRMSATNPYLGFFKYA